MDEDMKRQVEALKDHPDLYEFAKLRSVQKLAMETNTPLQSIALTCRNHFMQ